MIGRLMIACDRWPTFERSVATFPTVALANPGELHSERDWTTHDCVVYLLLSLGCRFEFLFNARTEMR